MCMRTACTYSLFFPNGTNFFGEEEEATDFEMLDCSQSVMDLDQEIAEFLKENGLYASKTFFLFEINTQHFNGKNSKLCKESKVLQHLLKRVLQQLVCELSR